MIYFSPRSVPALRNYSIFERAQIVSNAASNMPFARKAFSNTLKVLLLIALFWSVLSVPGVAWKIVAIFALGLLYPLVLQPITLSLAVPYIPQAVQEYERSKSYAANEPGSANESSENQSSGNHGSSGGNDS